MPPLFHVSEEADIEIFQPRLSTVYSSLGSVVWAVAESHLANYLLPRDCPRVTFCVTDATTAPDRERFNVAGSLRTVVIATSWVARVKAAVLYLYELPTTTFSLHDVSAGYWVSREAVVPLGVRLITDLSNEIRKRGADFRVVDQLRSLQEQVAASSLDYSIIRMRNADQ